VSEIETFEIDRELRTEVFEIVSSLQFSWSGRSSAVDILAVLYDLESLPSYDYRFSNARQDIIQHTESNFDWPDEWVLSDPRFKLLTGSDQVYLKFIAKCLSAKRDWELGEQEVIQKDINELLAETGHSIDTKKILSTGLLFQANSQNVESEIDVETLSGMFAKAGSDVLEIQYIRKMIVRASRAIEGEPELTIGTAKEILEATYKQLLKNLAVDFSEREQPGELAKKLYPELKLFTLGESDYFQKNLNKLLNAVVTSTTDIRNSKGTGHGRSNDTNTAIHLAKLVLLTVCVHCEFLVRQFELNNSENI
jgi:hypothetical protein